MTNLEVAKVEITVQHGGDGVHQRGLTGTGLTVQHNTTTVRETDTLVKVLVVLECFQIALEQFLVLLFERHSFEAFDVHERAGAAPVPVRVIFVPVTADGALRLLKVQVRLGDGLEEGSHPVNV